MCWTSTIDCMKLSPEELEKIKEKLAERKAQLTKDMKLVNKELHRVSEAQVVVKHGNKIHAVK